jgi:hypothetical protein
VRFDQAAANLPSDSQSDPFEHLNPASNRLLAEVSSFNLRPSDSQIAELPRAFGTVTLGDTKADIQQLTGKYNTVNPDTAAQERFQTRLTELSKTDHGKELIETLNEASSKPPAEAGKILAGALVKELAEKYKGGTVNFDESKNEFGALASMAVIIGHNDDSAGGAKELLVNSFNQEMGKRFVHEETASTGTATDSEGKSYNASPMMVLYKEPGRPPGMIAARENEIIDVLNWQDR